MGSALWQWSLRTATDGGAYPQLNDQGLADLIAGRFPAWSLAACSAGGGGVPFRIRDEASHDRQATVDRLRREIPTAGIADIVVAGTSWTAADGPAVRGGDRIAGGSTHPEGRHDEP